ncbi:MAG: hypothetical protein L0956_10875 [Candidatus Mariimomonas ferrooxydans]
MSSRIKKYFICVLAVVLVVAFTFTGWVSFQADTSAYAAEPTEPATEDGSPSGPCQPQSQGKVNVKLKVKIKINHREVHSDLNINYNRGVHGIKD